MSGFDAFHPPSAERLADCVHCGFCLPSCPTYALTGEEMDSPRGRIHLIGQGLGGTPLAGPIALHLDRCLSCLACVTACPSGVAYDELITDARAQVERQVRRPPGERMLRAGIFALFPYPRRLRLARALLAGAELAGLRRALASPRLRAHLPPLVATLDSLAPSLGPLERLPALVPAAGRRRGRVGLLTGCVQAVFFSSVNAATARVLAAEGFEVVVPSRQGCCGALSGHAGRREEAAAMARRTVATFERAGVDAVVVNSAGCGSAMKEYGRLLSDDPRFAGRAERLAASTRDLSELLAEAGPRAERHPFARTVAYHDACHLAHGQGIRDQPRQLLSAIPGLVLREIPEPELCCGSAGVYNLLELDWGRKLGERKAANVASTGADLLVAANPGCLMQLRARLGPDRIEVLHLAEVLDRSISGTG